MTFPLRINPLCRTTSFEPRVTTDLPVAGTPRKVFVWVSKVVPKVVARFPSATIEVVEVAKSGKPWRIVPISSYVRLQNYLDSTVFADTGVISGADAGSGLNLSAAQPT